MAQSADGHRAKRLKCATTGSGPKELAGKAAVARCEVGWQSDGGKSFPIVFRDTDVFRWWPDGVRSTVPDGVRSTATAASGNRTDSGFHNRGCPARDAPARGGQHARETGGSETGRQSRRGEEPGRWPGASFRKPTPGATLGGGARVSGVESNLHEGATRLARVTGGPCYPRAARPLAP